MSILIHFRLSNVERNIVMDTIWAPDLDVFAGPKYRRLTDALRQAVTEGQLLAGEKLPPVRDLAWRIGITPGTVARAYTILTDEGVLEAAVGRGTFVKTQSTAPALTPIEEDAVVHNSDIDEGPISLVSPALAQVGQARLIREGLARIAEEPPSGVMHYPNYDAARPAREAVARWLGTVSLGAVDESDVVLCHGGQNGILLILQAALSGVSPVLFVEDLSYPGFQRAAAQLRMRVVRVPMDEAGMRADALEEAMLVHGPGMVCTSPEVHNPTCIRMPDARRLEIVSICRRYNAHILEDDCYNMGSAQSASFRVLAPERTWYVTSISKSLTPALRIGFAIAPRERKGDLRRAAEYSYFGLATPITDLTAALLCDPRLPDVSQRIVSQMAQYTQILLNYLGMYDLSWQEEVPFVWLRLPAGWRTTAFCQASEAAGIRLRPAEDFAGRDARVPHAVRISINSVISKARFEEAMKTLRDLLDNPPERIGV